MNKDKDHIDQLTPDMMQEYLDGKLSSEMQYKVERYLLDHPFEGEAMEGFEAVSMTQLKSDIGQMKKDLFAEEEGIKTISIWQQYWKVAAVVTVLIVSTFLILNLGERQINSSDKELALNEEPSATEEAVTFGDKEVMEESVATEENSTEEETQDVITKPKVEQQPIVEVKEDFVVIEYDIEELIESSETLALNDVSLLTKSTETSRAKVINEERVKVLSMTESDDLAEEKAINDEKVVKRGGINITDQLSSKVAGVSISKRKKDSRMNPAKEKIVRGSITSAEDGSSLPGVNVILKGTNQGVISDVNGNYEMKIPDGQHSFAISFIGYINEEIEVGDRNVVDVSMSVDVSSLSEVVVTGYGKSRNSNSKKVKIRKLDAKPLIGFEAYDNYLKDSLVYPQQAIDNQISGKVLLELIINETGHISNVVVREGVGYGCDEEAIRLIKEGPKWQPAIKRGKSVQEKVKLEVAFYN